MVTCERDLTSFRCFFIFVIKKHNLLYITGVGSGVCVCVCVCGGGGMGARGACAPHFFFIEGNGMFVRPNF